MNAALNIITFISIFAIAFFVLGMFQRENNEYDIIKSICAKYSGLTSDNIIKTQNRISVNKIINLKLKA